MGITPPRHEPVITDGDQRWYRRNVLHRDDGPAVILTDGTKLWYCKGYLHRENGPAAIYPTGLQRWYRWGQLHRDDGPASIWEDGPQYWYRNGKRVEPPSTTEEESPPMPGWYQLDKLIRESQMPWGPGPEQNSYRYQALQHDGSAINGVIQARDENHAKQLLRLQGLFVTSLMLVPSDRGITWLGGVEEDQMVLGPNPYTYNQPNQAPDIDADEPGFNLRGGYKMVTTAERNKKILMDLTVDGATIVPFGMGTMILIGNWAVQGGPMGFLIGFGAMLIGGGVALTKVTFGWGKMVAKYEAAEERKKAAARKEEIKKLNAKLKQRGDMEGHVLLVELNSLYDAFQSNIEDRTEAFVEAGIVNKVEKLFEAALDYIERAYQLRKTAKKLREGSQDPILAKRKEMLEAVQKCVDSLNETVQQTESRFLIQDHGKLERLREQLDEQLDADQYVADHMSAVDDMIRDAQ